MTGTGFRESVFGIGGTLGASYGTCAASSESRVVIAETGDPTEAAFLGTEVEKSCGECGGRTILLESGETGEIGESGGGVDEGDSCRDDSLEASESSGAGGIRASGGGGAGKGFCSVDLRTARFCVGGEPEVCASWEESVPDGASCCFDASRDCCCICSCRIC